MAPSPYSKLPAGGVSVRSDDPDAKAVVLGTLDMLAKPASPPITWADIEKHFGPSAAKLKASQERAAAPVAQDRRAA